MSESPLLTPHFILKCVSLTTVTMFLEEELRWGKTGTNPAHECRRTLLNVITPSPEPGLGHSALQED
jgi:hypothetical protein